jgi:hypothetical protein
MRSRFDLQDLIDIEAPPIADARAGCGWSTVAGTSLAAETASFVLPVTMLSATIAGSALTVLDFYGPGAWFAEVSALDGGSHVHDASAYEPTHPNSRIDELLPCAYPPAPPRKDVSLKTALTMAYGVVLFALSALARPISANL